jgi:hypothetical protein
MRSYDRAIIHAAAENSRRENADSCIDQEMVIITIEILCDT